MADQNVPRAKKAEMLPNLYLRIEFDNGEVHYFKTRLGEELGTTSQTKNAFVPPTQAWIGSQPKILDDGSIQLNEATPYSAEELYQNSVTHI